MHDWFAFLYPTIAEETGQVKYLFQCFDDQNFYPDPTADTNILFSLVYWLAATSYTCSALIDYYDFVFVHNIH
jgi:hypothetical protein